MIEMSGPDALLEGFLMQNEVTSIVKLKDFTKLHLFNRITIIV